MISVTKNHGMHKLSGMIHHVSDLYLRTFCILMCVMIALGCRTERRTKAFHAMGGIPVHIIATGLSNSRLDTLTDEAQALTEEWEDELSLYRPQSAVNQIKSQPGTVIQLSAYGWEAVESALQASLLTNRAFDITVGPLVRLWKKAEQENQLPTAEEIHTARSSIGFEHLILNQENRTISLDPAFLSKHHDTDTPVIVSLDVGGIAKGLFAEWIHRLVVESLTPGERTKLQKLIIDLGGDMYVSSSSAEKPCKIGIRNPFSNDRSDLWGIVDLSSGAIVTSGSYERSYLVNGKHYCHIIDPTTGYPVETSLVSVTILDPSGAMADALATAVFVMGEDRARALVATRPRTEMVLIRSDGTWFCTDSLHHRLQILDRSSPSEEM